MVDDDGAVGTRQIVSLLLLVTVRFASAGLVLVDRLKLEPSDLVDSNGQDTTGVVFRWRRSDEQLVLPVLKLSSIP